ncbi:Zn-dependent exopeptidase [Dacryopinax primogenitus]|uniref:Peptide hydrolase n=1 Tax=Dacryopinax primogenitus (strain DJM 731) TaxID=1858805 RepID=M5G6B3_DACPD|nr:Zn-dependent exopeptidase [Dacryopinax primogenitus]EJT99307.1 Zn-dependent exopeptidase [Dacryopinax primogenitus]
MLAYLALAVLPGLALAQHVLIVTDTNAGEVPSCVAQSYHGTYGQPLRSVYVPSQECLESINTDSLFGSFESGHLDVLDFDPEGRQLLWVQVDQVDPSLLESDTQLANDWFSTWAMGLTTPNTPSLILEDTESVLRTQSLAPSLHYLSADAALLSLALSVPFSDLDLPRYVSMYSLTRVPHSPVPFSTRLFSVLAAKPTFDPSVASVLSTLSPARMLSDVRYLTGEDGIGPLTRHSFSKGALTAADWIQEKIEASGATCEQKTFLPGFAPNVVCKYPASGNETDRVILSAHYDSRGSFGSTPAPGGDDDGSGTTHLLSIAHAIQEKGVVFQRPVELVAFAGEEQGLFGSKAYARELKSKNVSIALMIQADMLGYHAPGEPAQLGLPATIGSPAAAFLVSNLSSLYAPELIVGYTYACCSDHQSFHEQGYTATQVFERAGPIADPMYHNSGDFSNRTGYDVEQIRSIAKVTFAAVLYAAGWELGDA